MAEGCSVPIMDRAWVREAVQKINADFNRSADTHLIKVDLPAFPDQTLYLKDESTHPSGSLTLILSISSMSPLVIVGEFTSILHKHPSPISAPTT